MPDTTPRIERSREGDTSVAVLLGEWTAAQFGQPRLFKRLLGALPAAAPAQAWDLRGAGQLDHVGAQLLWDHWQRRWPASPRAVR